MSVCLLNLETSWKRPDTGERVGDREEVFRAMESSRQESEPDLPKPAEGEEISLLYGCQYLIKN